MTLIAPSLLSSDFSKLGEEVRALEKAGADWIHFDIMDSHFVPDISFGPLVIQALRDFSSLPFDVHLMVSQPEKFIRPMALAGANSLSFHIEAAPSPQNLLKEVKKHGLKAGLSLKPESPIELLFPFLEDLDLVLVMTVEPGKSGQKFLKKPAEKVGLLRRKVMPLKNPPLIAVDGGINSQTAKWVSGADVLVSGHYIFKSRGDYSIPIAGLRKA